MTCGYAGIGFIVTGGDGTPWFSYSDNHVFVKTRRVPNIQFEKCQPVLNWVMASKKNNLTIFLNLLLSLTMSRLFQSLLENVDDLMVIKTRNLPIL
jgi:hypothetical protein